MTVVSVVAGCATITPPCAGPVEDAAAPTALQQQATTTAINMTITTIILTTITATIQPARPASSDSWLPQYLVVHVP